MNPRTNKRSETTSFTPRFLSFNRDLHIILKMVFQLIINYELFDVVGMGIYVRKFDAYSHLQSMFVCSGM